MLSFSIDTSTNLCFNWRNCFKFYITDIYNVLSKLDGLSLFVKQQYNETSKKYLVLNVPTTYVFVLLYRLY